MYPIWSFQMKQSIIRFAACALAAFSFSAAQAQSGGEYVPPAGMQQYGGNQIFSETPAATASPQLSAPLPGGWYGQEGLYTPFATWTMTADQQHAYLLTIQKIWPWVFDGVQAWEVNDEMAEIVDIVLEEIADCSKAMFFVDLAVDTLHQELVLRKVARALRQTVYWLYNHVYSPISTYYTVQDLIDDVFENSNYKICVNTAAWQWRTPMDLAYWDY